MDIIFKLFKTLDSYYVYDRNTNSTICISKEEYEELTEVHNKTLNIEDSNVIRKYQEKGHLKQSTLKAIEHIETKYLEYDINNKLHQIILQVTQNCTLRCSYCPYSGNYINRMHSGKKMNFEMAKKGVDYLIAHSSGLDELAIAFYGGEPLLEYDLIKKVIEYTNKVGDGKKFTWAMTTNATLLNDEIIEFFIKHKVDIMISLDGPKEVHDTNRVFANAEGSFDTIMSKLTHIKEKYPEYYKTFKINTVVATTTDLNSVKEFYETDPVVQDLEIMVSPVHASYKKDAVLYSERHTSLVKYEKFKLLLYMLKKIPKESVSKLNISDVALLEEFYEQMRYINQLPEKCHHSGPCIPGSKRLFITCDGWLYPCEKVSEESNVMRLGHIDSGIDIEKAEALINFGKVTEDECIQCWNFKFCKMCASEADTTTEFSRDKKLSACAEKKQRALENLKIICFLKEQNYKFGGANQNG